MSESDRHVLDWAIAPSLKRLAMLPGTNHAEQVARNLLTTSGYTQAEVSILLTDDPGIHELNRLWRGYDKPTDVLSWPQSEETVILSPADEVVLGDVAISLDTATRQAKARSWSIEEEIALLLIHGILHLMGHEDESESGAEEMRQIEQHFLGKPLEKIEGT